MSSNSVIKKALGVQRDSRKGCYIKFQKISQNEKGTNELSIAKATGFFKLFPKLNEILFSELIEELREQNRLTKKNTKLTSEKLNS